MKRRTPFLFGIQRPGDVWVDRVILYALSKPEAIRYAEAWARRLGYRVELADEDAA